MLSRLLPRSSDSSRLGASQRILHFFGQGRVAPIPPKILPKRYPGCTHNSGIVIYSYTHQVLNDVCPLDEHVPAPQPLSCQREA